MQEREYARALRSELQGRSEVVEVTTDDGDGLTIVRVRTRQGARVYRLPLARNAPESAELRERFVRDVASTIS